MDRRQLTTALLASGVPPESFQITGIHTHEPLPTDFWFLRPSPTGWEVGTYERGRYEVREHFPTETAAAAWLFRTLTGQAPP
ncbi:hypothetical protein NDR87_09475 [Nocardia sp. CDC159]|uniref:Uncharacterized protein n=1 Tax=Nocardia pulmonis TaxID=2951408 RepID=A0A9X2E8Z4_9NOCA|nr:MULTISPECIES: hypothetical protein [Nocardia]MCM6773698.1 hypothetical protein [Nocardia pulmonis]MCM6786585.1 hypothetical protein [Nocardia sp. CDC159]